MTRYILVLIILLKISFETFAQNIVKLEYSIDEFVREGSGSTIDLPGNANTLNSVFDINIEGLEPGLHVLHFRALNDDGVWSLPAEKTFYVQPPDSLAPTYITKLEYFIDDFVREGTGSPLSLASEIAEVDSVFSIDISGLAAGVHTLYYRALDSKGKWSLPAERNFYVQAQDTAKVKDIFYRFYNDDYQGEWQSSSLSPPQKQVDSTFKLPVDGLTNDTQYSVEFYAVNNMDLRGLPAFIEDFVLRLNHAPEALQASVALSTMVNQSLTISLDTLFHDQDIINGDSLAYSIADPEGSGIEDFLEWGEGSNLSFVPTADQDGTYNFWIIATDLAGEKDSLTVQLEVEPATIHLVNPITDQLVDQGFGTINIDLSDVFSYTGLEALSYAPASTNEDVVTVSVSGSVLTISEVGTGSSEVTITAQDDHGAEASDSFTVQVAEGSGGSNSPPVVDNPVDDLEMEEGFGSFDLAISAVFSDPDGDELNVSASSSNESVVTVSVSGSTLTVTEVGIGSSKITFTASDGKGGEATDEFEIEVKSAQTTITSLSDDENVQLFKVFPNPARNLLSIEIVEAAKESQFEIELLDVLGRNCYSSVVANSNRHTFNVGKLKNGLYLVKITLNGEVYFEKVLIE